MSDIERTLSTEEALALVSDRLGQFKEDISVTSHPVTTDWVFVYCGGRKFRFAPLKNITEPGIVRKVALSDGAVRQMLEGNGILEPLAGK